MGRALPTAPPGNDSGWHVWKDLRFFRAAGLKRGNQTPKAQQSLLEDSKINSVLLSIPSPIQASAPYERAETGAANEGHAQLSPLAWEKLATEAKEIETEFETQLAQLEKDQLKRSIPKKQELHLTQCEIRKAIKLVKAVAEAATAVETASGDEENQKVKDLEAKMQLLQIHCTAIKKQIPSQKGLSALLDIVTYLSPLVGGVWYLLIQIKILVASSPLVVGIAFIGWVGLALVNAKQCIENRIVKIKAEDREQLIEHYGSLIVTFEGMKEKMNISDIRQLRRDTTEIKEVNIRQINEMKEQLRDLRDLMSSVSQGSSKTNVSKDESRGNQYFLSKIQETRQLVDKETPKEEILKLIDETIKTLQDNIAHEKNVEMA